MKADAKKVRSKVTPYLFVAPHLAMFAIFVAFPTLYSMFMSLFKWNWSGTPKFVGFANYHELLFEQSGYHRDFFNALHNNLIYVIFAVPLLIIVPLILASLISANPPGASFFQAVFFLPCLLSVSTVALMWRWLFDRTFGLVNQVLGLNIAWTMAEPYFWIAIILMSIWWSIGGALMIFIAGMANIPPELYEAAELDGAGGVRRFFDITLPGLRHQIVYTLMMTMISSFKIYGEVLMFSGASGRPSMDKNVPMIMIQQLAFGDSSDVGMATTMAVLLSVVIIFFSFFTFRDRLARAK